VLANVMFAGDAVSVSGKDRASSAHFVSEVVATFGLLMVIFALTWSGRARTAAAAVGAYIGAAYFFTSSTSFANPAITIGRIFTNTFAGIAPASAQVFIAAQVTGAVLAVLVVRVLYPGVTPVQAAEVTVLHPAIAARRPARRVTGTVSRPDRHRVSTSRSDSAHRQGSHHHAPGHDRRQ
jgi:arsenate reductase